MFLSSAVEPNLRNNAGIKEYNSRIKKKRKTYEKILLLSKI